MPRLLLPLALAVALGVGAQAPTRRPPHRSRLRRRCWTPRSPRRQAPAPPRATPPTGRARPASWEVALGYTAGGTLNVQACRRSGDAASVAASLEFAAVRPGALEEAKANPPKLVSVITPTEAQKQQLLALGLDMTEHGGKESLGVVLHGPDDEAALRKAGLRRRVLVGDLAARSAADRAADRRFAARAAAAAVPRGRTTYRTLADYNDHLRGAAAVHARPGGVLHAHLRVGRARVRDPAGAGRPRPGQAARPASRTPASAPRARARAGSASASAGRRAGR